MKPFVLLGVACILLFSTEVRAQDAAAEDQYFDVYSLILKADTLADKGKADAARSNYIQAEVALKKLQEDHPLWNTQVIKYRLDYLNAKITGPATPVKKPGTPPVPVMKRSVSAVDSPAAALNPAAPLVMKIKWNVGTRYLDRITLTATGQMTPSGQQQAQSGDLKLSQDFAISALKERDNGGRDLQVELLDTDLKVTDNGQTQLSFNSKTAPAGDNSGDPVSSTLKRLAGAKLRLLTDGVGHIESLEGLDDFIKAVAGPGAPTSQELLSEIPTGAAGTNGTMDKLRDMQTFTSFLPDGPIKVGDTWSKTAEAPAQDLGAMAGTITYTFTGWEQHDGHNCAVIAFQGSLGSKPAGGDATAAASPVNIQAGISGKYWYDPALGMITEATASPDINGSGMLNLKLNLVADYKVIEVASIAD